MVYDIFRCHKCGKQANLGPSDINPEPAVCEDCCDDHEYKYDRWGCVSECVHCGKRRPEDWYDE